MDLLILDEYDSYPRGSWESVFEPMLLTTKGYAIITGTIQGAEESGEIGEAAVYRTALTAGFMTEEEIRKTRVSFTRRGKEYIFEQEYMCNPYASESNELPFVEYLPLISFDAVVPEGGNHYHIFDIGSSKNMVSTYIKKNNEGKPIVVEQLDCFNGLKSIIPILHERHPHGHINLVFPVDLHQPSIMEGGTRESNLLDHIKSLGLARRFSVHVLPKITDKKAAFEESFDCWGVLGYANSARGIVKMLGRAKFKKEKATGHVFVGQLIKNGADHYADSWLYAKLMLMYNPEIFYSDGKVELDGYRDITYNYRGGGSGGKQYRYG